MMTMIYVNPFPSEKLPHPSPILIGTGWIQMIESADFVPEKPAPVAMPKGEAGEKPVELHQENVPIAMAMVMRTKITMHNGSPLWVKNTVDEIKALMS